MLDSHRAPDDSPTPAWEASWAAQAKRNAARIAEAAVGLRQIYEAGSPFFTKSDIQHLASQLRNINSRIKHEGPRRGKASVLIRQVDGTTRKEAVALCPPSIWASRCSVKDIGQDGSHRTTSLEDTLKYQIWYRSYQALLAFGHFAPLDVVSEACRRDRFSGELIPAREVLLLKDVRSSLREAIRVWNAGKCAQELQASLESVSTESLTSVTKIIAFSCGPISLRDHDCSRSLRQHAFMLSIKNILESCRNSSGAKGELRCYVQDPAYTETDRIVLQEHGIEILEDPQAFLEVDEDSAVLSFASNVPVKQIVADIARPVMVAWETAGHQDGLKNRYIECLGVTRTAEKLAGSEEFEANS